MTAAARLTGTSAYDLEAGTVSATLGGSVGFNKTTPGSVTFTMTPPNGPYTISAGTLVLGTLVEDDVGRLVDDERRHA